MKKINSSVIMGFFLVLIGAVLCLQIINVDLNFNTKLLWYSILALAGVVIMINDRKVTIIPSIMVVIGVWFALKVIGIITVSLFSLIWPIIIIIVGLNFMLARNLFPKMRTKEQVKEGILEYNGIFGGVEERLNTKDFKGLNANAVFGGVELDLRDVEVKDKEVFIDASAVFAGITIIMPDKYNVVIGESVGIFGGNDNKFKGQYDEKKSTIYINCRAIFGGIEIK